MSVALTLLLANADAACPAPVGTDAVQGALDTAELAFANLDVTAFDGATDAALGLLPCVSEPMSRQLAASVHRFVGLRRFVDRDLDAARSSFAAARSIEPGFAFASSFVPDDNPVRVEYAAIDPATGAGAEAPPVDGGYLLFDGSIGTTRPTSFPTIVQVMNGDGTVSQTAYLSPGQALPTYAIGTPDLPGPDHPLRAPLLASGGGALVLAGALYGLAWVSRSNYDDPAIETEAQLDALRAQTNALTITSFVAGGVALGLGVSGVAFTADF